MSIQEAWCDSETKRVYASCLGMSWGFLPPRDGEMGGGGIDGQKKKTWRLRRETEGEWEDEGGGQSHVIVAQRDMMG